MNASLHAPQPPPATKIVLVGPVGVGKTTAIRALAVGEPVCTEMPVTEGVCGNGRTTTVALDFSDVAMHDGRRLLAFGLPGQDRYAFMQPIVLSGALGAIALLDARSTQIESDCRQWLEVIRAGAPQAAIVVGVTHGDLLPSFSIEPLRAMLRGLPQQIEAFALDARERAQIEPLLRVLIASHDTANADAPRSSAALQVARAEARECRSAHA